MLCMFGQYGRYNDTGKAPDWIERKVAGKCARYAELSQNSAFFDSGMGVLSMLHDKLTLGSLFDGSGGFPLGGLLSGITPVWASEIEPFPIRLTTKRLPFMKHYGDVSRMDGAEVEPVDIITSSARPARI